MPNYLLAAKLEVSGASDFISDLERASLAAQNAAREIRGASGASVSLSVRGFDKFVLDMEMAGRTAREAFEKIERLGVGTEAKLEAKGVPEFVGDMDRAGQAAQRAGREIEAATNGADANFRKASGAGNLLEQGLGRIMESAKMLVGFQFVIGIEQGLREAATEILAFDKAIVNALSIDPEAAAFRGEMEKTARTISKELGTPVSEVALGFYDLAAAGRSTKQALEEIGPIARFAKAGMVDMNTAVERAMQLTAIFEPTGKSTADILDIIGQAANISVGGIEGFADSLTNKAGTAAVQFHQPMEEVVGLLAAFAQRGLQGKAAGEGVSQILRDMALKSIGPNKAAWDDLGISVYDANGKMRLISEIIPQLQESLGGMSDAQRGHTLQMLGFQLRSVTHVSSLLAMGDAQKYFTDRLYESEGVIDNMVKVQLTSLQAKLDILKTNAIDIAITGFEKLVEAIDWIKTTFTPAFNALKPAFAIFMDGFGQMVAAVAPIVGGAIVGTLEFIAAALEKVGKFAQEHSEAVRVFGAVVAAVTFGALIKEVGEFVLLLSVRLAGSLVRTGMSLTELATGPVAIFIAAMAGLAYGVKQEEKNAKAMAQAVKDAFDTSTVQGMRDAGVALGENEEKWRGMAKEARGFGDFIRTTLDVLPVFDFKNTSADLNGAAEAAKRLRLETELAAGAAEVYEQLTSATVESLSSFLSGKDYAGPMVGNLGMINEEVERLARGAGLSAGQIDLSSGAIRRLAIQNDIDLTRPFTEWLPSLINVTVQTEAVKQKLQEFGLTAMEADPLAEALTTTMDNQGETVKEVAERFKALTEAIEALIMGPLTALGAEGKVHETFATLKTDTDKFGLSLDVATEGGRKVVASLTDAVEAGYKWARIQAGDDPILYAKKVDELRESFRLYAQGMGLTTEQVEAFLVQIGLTPEVVVMAVELSGEKEALASLDAATKPRVVDLGVLGNASMGLAMAGLDALTGSRTVVLSAKAETAMAARELNSAAAWRQADLVGFVTNFGQVDAAMSYLARTRYSYLVIQATYLAAQSPGGVGGVNLPALADGGVVDFYAGGGMRENHVAQIARPGSWRVWGEPETGGEAYIPLAASKRNRSMQIWEETGRRLGAIKNFADGGIAQSAARVAGASGVSGDVRITISPGAIQAHVSAQVGADPQHLANLIQDGLRPALEEFGQDLVANVRRRRL